MIPTLHQDFKIVQAIQPQAAGGAKTGAWANLANALRAWIVVNISQAGATGTTLTVNQATTAAGAGSKQITSGLPIFGNEAFAAGAENLTRQVSDNGTYTSTTTTGQKQVVIQIDPALLDHDNGYSYISVSASAMTASDFIQAEYFLDPRYNSDSMPAALV